MSSAPTFVSKRTGSVADTYLFPYRSWRKPGGERADDQNPEGETPAGPPDVKGRTSTHSRGHNLLPGREKQQAVEGVDRALFLDSTELSRPAPDILPDLDLLAETALEKVPLSLTCVPL